MSSEIDAGNGECDRLADTHVPDPGKKKQREQRGILQGVKLLQGTQCGLLNGYPVLSRSLGRNKWPIRISPAASLA